MPTRGLPQIGLSTGWSFRPRQKTIRPAVVRNEVRRGQAGERRPPIGGHTGSLHPSGQSHVKVVITGRLNMYYRNMY
jgi:hypothetical protein